MTNKTPQWEEKFDNVMPKNWSDKGVSRLEIKAFIKSTLEELINDIYITADSFELKIDLTQTKQQLKDKWL